MIKLSEVAFQANLTTLDISRKIESLNIKSKRIGRSFYITELEKDKVLLSLYFNLKIEFITLQSKMNYEN